MVDGIGIQGVPAEVSADTLRNDLENLIKSHNGNREIRTRMGTGMQEIYEIPETGTLIVQTDDSMNVNVMINQVKSEGQVTARNQTLDVNALVLFMGFKSAETYLRLSQDLSNLPKSYES